MSKYEEMITPINSIKFVVGALITIAAIVSYVDLIDGRSLLAAIAIGFGSLIMMAAVYLTLLCGLKIYNSPAALYLTGRVFLVGSAITACATVMSTVAHSSQIDDIANDVKSKLTQGACSEISYSKQMEWKTDIFAVCYLQGLNTASEVGATLGSLRSVPGVKIDALSQQVAGLASSTTPKLSDNRCLRKIQELGSICPSVSALIDKKWNSI